MIHILNKENTILNKFLAQIRDRVVQRDSMRFRRNIERIGEVMAYEISRALDYKTQIVETPLGEAAVEMISDKIVIATILRAGLPLQSNSSSYPRATYSCVLRGLNRPHPSSRRCRHQSY